MALKRDSQTSRECRNELMYRDRNNQDLCMLSTDGYVSDFNVEMNAIK
jgi:hypothetical protein